MKILLFLLFPFCSFGQLILTTVGNGGGGTPTVPGNYYVKKSGSDGNAGTNSQPFLTCQKCADVVQPGGKCIIGTSGQTETYRESILMATSGTALNRIVFENASGATVVISGADDAGSSGWTLHSTNVWKKTITLPQSAQWITAITTNTTLLNNQVWDNGVAMIQARWPNIDSYDDLFDRSKWRDDGNTTTFTNSTISDTGIPTIDYTGAAATSSGWFITKSAPISSRSGTTLTLGAGFESGSDFHKRYFLWGALGLLDYPGEFYYSGGVLYVYATSSPTNITYKKFNNGIDFNGKDYITIRGIKLFGCGVIGTNTDHMIYDGRPSETTDTLTYATVAYPYHGMFAGNQNLGLDAYSGFQVTGGNNEFRNLYITNSQGTAIWGYNDDNIHNNHAHAISYLGNYGAFVRPWAGQSRVRITDNTGEIFGRSAIDYGNQASDTHNDMVIAWNNFGEGGLISSDGSLLYGSQGVRTDGTIVHHNWWHHFNALTEGAAGGDKGAQIVSHYGDQYMGPVTFYYNIGWGTVNYTNGIVFHQTGGSVPASSFLNNTWDTAETASYINYTDGARDVIRNNIARSGLNWCNGDPSCAPGSAASNNLTSNPNFVGGFSAHDGRQYQVQSGSAAINAGVVVPGITPGSGVTIGGYQFGVTAWVPGCGF